MATKTLERHIESTPGTLGGKPRIVGRRIAIEHIAISHERMGMSAAEIANEYDLTLGQVHAALAYYFDHREQIDRDIRDGEAFVEAMRRKSPSILKQKLAEKKRRGAKR